VTALFSSTPFVLINDNKFEKEKAEKEKAEKEKAEKEKEREKEKEKEKEKKTSRKKPSLKSLKKQASFFNLVRRRGGSDRTVVDAAVAVPARTTSLEDSNKLLGAVGWA
jgi:TPP-dependent trihydroxycyclohexane-1,2-dione (THcHDO) dehydratase